jgi:OmpA-OmpF porin, OOP family
MSLNPERKGVPKRTVAFWTVILVAIAAVIIHFTNDRGIKGFLESIAPSRHVKESVTTTKVKPTQDLTGIAKRRWVTEGAAPLSLPPSNQPAIPTGPQVTFVNWFWNTHLGAFYANGGPATTQGSFYDKLGINIRFVRNDAWDFQRGELVKFVDALASGQANPTVGCNFTSLMGDGAAQYINPLNDFFAEKYPKDPDLRIEVVGGIGYSYGEDQFMAPPAVKFNPELLRGMVIAGVIRDGDWNIAIYFAMQYNIPINCDDGTYDPNALNFFYTSDFVKPAILYNENFQCQLLEKVNGKLTGRTITHGIDGIVTWTPGDIIAALGSPDSPAHGGLATIRSTRDYNNQMPNTIIGIVKWDKAHADFITNMLLGAAQGAEQINAYPEALHAAARIAAVIYHQKGVDEAYIYKYYLGEDRMDITGTCEVHLGGSYANNLNDMAETFGLGATRSDKWTAMYEYFGNIVHEWYPKDMPRPADAKEVLNLTYLKAALARGSRTVPALAQQLQSGPIVEVTGEQRYFINFQLGSAGFQPSAYRQLETLRQALLVGTVKAEILGWASVDGDPDSNLHLSNERAIAVQNYLQGVDPVTFGPDKVTARGMGSTSQFGTELAKNRCVQVIIGR